MKRAIFIGAAAIGLLLIAPAATAELNNITARSVVRLQLPHLDNLITYCTGFVIDSVRGYVMTADHCLEPTDNPIINGQQAEEIFHNPALDLAILSAPSVKGLPALVPYTAVELETFKATAYGYADGGELKTIDVTPIASVPFNLKTIPNRDYIIYIPAVIKGMSGGPVVDESNRVITVNQMIVATGISAGTAMSQAYVGSEEFWEFKAETK